MLNPGLCFFSRDQLHEMAALEIEERGFGVEPELVAKLARLERGGGVEVARMASSSALFQLVTTLADADPQAADSREATTLNQAPIWFWKAIDLIVTQVVIGLVGTTMCGDIGQKKQSTLRVKLKE